MILFIFINASNDNDSILDRNKKELAKTEQSKKIARLYPKKRLKYEKSIKREKIIIFILEFKIIVMSLKGKNPPEDIKLIDRLNESKVLKIKNFQNYKN